MKNIYSIRRNNLVKQLKNKSLTVLYSQCAPVKSADENYPFTVHRSFYYLTGIDRENMILVFIKDDKGNVEERLYIEPFDEVMAKWVGPKMLKEEAKAICGIEKIGYIDEFEADILKFYQNLELEILYIDSSNILSDELKDFILDSDLEQIDMFNMIAKLRMIKDETEIEQMMVAQNTTRIAIEEMMRYVKPGMNECEIEGAFDFALRKQSVKEHAFPSIVAGGKRATTLHYSDNNQVVEDNELILIDLGSAHNHYCADISRTFPVNGKFTDRQKEIYEAVLTAHELVIENAKPGLTRRDLNQMVIKYYATKLKELGLLKNGKKVSDYYYHGVSHQLGLDTHDVEPEEENVVLQPGMVITVEPGLYIEEESIGIRIENDILITEDKAIDLSKDILKTVEDIENFMN